jgi:hypothetical protein
LTWYFGVHERDGVIIIVGDFKDNNLEGYLNLEGLGNGK